VIELAAPVAFVGNGHVKGVECVRAELGSFDGSGRRKPVFVENSNFVIDADLVIPAVSQTWDYPFISKDEVQITSWGSLL
jgi:NADPH-dependent glutamate synthase beta subunit-like oxidoreductase